MFKICAIPWAWGVCCILLFLDKDVCMLYLQARVYRWRYGRYDLEGGDVLWAKSPRRLDLHYSRYGMVGSLWLCIAGDSANSKAFQTETLVVANNVSTTFLKMRTKTEFCIIHIVLNILYVVWKRTGQNPVVQVGAKSLQQDLPRQSTSRTAIIHETAVQWTQAYDSWMGAVLSVQVDISEASVFT